MKVSFNPVGVSSVYTALFDEADGDGTCLAAFDPEWHPQPQKAALSGSVVPFLSPRTSLGWSFTLSYLQFYATLAEAAKAELGDEVTTLRILVNNIKKEQGTTAVFYPGCVCDSYRAVPRGLSVQHTFAFTGKEPTIVDPASP